jgi:hypothetical protein
MSARTARGAFQQSWTTSIHKKPRRAESEGDFAASARELAEEAMELPAGGIE